MGAASSQASVAFNRPADGSAVAGTGVSAAAAPAKVRRPGGTSIDLGALREVVRARAVAEGVTTSAWIKRAVGDALGKSSLPGHQVPAKGVDASLPGVYRLWLDAALTAKLDKLVTAGGFRDRHACVEALVGRGEGSDAGIAQTSASVAALMQSNHTLATIYSTLNKLARGANPINGRSGSTDADALEAAIGELRAHLKVSARLTAELLPLVKKDLQ